MKKENKIYITASELSEMLGVSLSKSYRLIKTLNQELEEKGFLSVRGKVPTRYFEKRWFGAEINALSAKER